jgi:hypothetical protein
MNIDNLKKFIQEIVKKATELKNKHTSEKKASVNYACIFCQNNEQYEDILETIKKLGKIIKETPTGPLFHIAPLDTIAGKLNLLKIRKPDPTKPELGDADFTVGNYSEFKKINLSKKGFSLVTRENFEMIELVDSDFNVKAYFSNPTLEKQLNIAPCGINCSTCEAFLAKKENYNKEKREKIAKEWAKKYNHPGLKADDMLCDGCRSSGTLFSHCKKCKIRKEIKIQ